MTANPAPASQPDLHRVAIYARARNIVALDGQHTALLTHVVIDQHAHWQLIAAFGDLTAHSGLNHPRPGLQMLLYAAAFGTFDLLLVHRLDRLSRRTAVLHQILTHLDTAGVTIATLADATTPTDPDRAASSDASTGQVQR